MDYRRICEVSENRSVKSALCIVTETSGSTPRKASARMLVFQDGTKEGSVEGSVGGGAIEHRIRQEALAAICAGHPRLVKVALTNELGMCCGGQMTIYIEPLQANPALIILGAGHIGEAVCRIGSQSGFDVFIADPRRELLSSERLPFAKHFYSDYSAFELDQMPFSKDAFVLIATHDHHVDQALVELILPREYCQLGLIASQRKATLTRQRCLAKGFSKTLVENLTSPVGLDIDAQTPAEIAISIVAQMVQIRRHAQRTSLRGTYSGGG